MNHWIALYLSGQYPGFYRLPNRFEVIRKIRQADPTNFNENMIALIKDKYDIEFYNTLLSEFQELHGDKKHIELLEKLSIPEQVRRDPHEKQAANMGVVNLHKIEAYLKNASEEQFSRFIVMPILQAMGYENVEYKGKVSESDFGTDFYVARFKSPGDITHYVGIQIKACKMTNGDTSKPGSELNKLIAETKTAFGQPHMINTGEKVLISELLIMNSAEVTPSAKYKLFEDVNIRDKKIKFWAKDGILSLLTELKLGKAFFENFEEK